VSLFLTNLIKFVKNNNLNFNIDYFLAIFNLNIFLPLVFLSNNFYTFIFLLEINSLLILYKFSVSKFWFNKNEFFEKYKNPFDRLVPKFFLNMIFFQY
jgi:hypothetical protein